MTNSIYLDNKPLGCAECQYASVGQGFCPDWSPPEPKIAILLEAPGDNEIIDKQPLVGASGYVFNKNFLFKLGYTRADVLLANTLRCHPPGNIYPIGEARRHAEQNCRQYDSLLDTFAPTHYLVTIHPAAMLRTWSLMRVVQNDIAKAFRLSEAGRRILVLMGDKAMNLVAPQLDGGPLRWRSHWDRLDWKSFRSRYA